MQDGVFCVSARLYDIDAEINANPICDACKLRSLPILEAIKTRLDQDSAILSTQTKTYEAVNNALKMGYQVLRYANEHLSRIDNNQLNKPSACQK